MSTSALLSMLSAVNNSVNRTAQELLTLKNDYQEFKKNGISNVVAPVENKEPEQNKDVDELKKKTQSLFISIDTLNDNVKKMSGQIAQIKEEMQKDRMLIETSLTHKLEQFVSRMVKEKTDSVLNESKAYTDSKVELVDANLTSSIDALKVVAVDEPVASRSIEEVSSSVKDIDVNVINTINNLIDNIQTEAPQSSTNEFDLDFKPVTKKGMGKGGKRYNK